MLKTIKKRKAELGKRLRERVDSRHEKPAFIQCKGCGREIDVREIKPLEKFICKKCMRAMRLNPPLYTFQFTPRTRLKKRLLNVFIGALILTASIIWGQKLVATMGHPVFLWGISGGVAAALAVYVVIAREFTQEYRLVTAFTLLTLGGRRMVLYPFALDWGHQNPLAILLPGFLGIFFGAYNLVLVYWRRKTLPIL